MNERAYAVFVVRDGEFVICENGDGFPVDLATYLWLNSPTINGTSALAKFYADDLPEGPYNLTPMPGSTYTHAYFWRDDSGGITVIKGRYW